jgi:hypothetical protein
MWFSQVELLGFSEKIPLLRAARPLCDFALAANAAPVDQMATEGVCQDGREETCHDTDFPLAISFMCDSFFSFYGRDRFKHSDSIDSY